MLKNSKSASTGLRKANVPILKQQRNIHNDDQKYWMSMNGKAVGMDFKA